MKKSPVLLLLVCVFTQGLFAQATAKDTLAISFSAYVEPYYNVDLNKPSTGTRPDFIYAYNRNNEVNIHLGFIKAALASNRVRANAAFAVGTYMNANYGRAEVFSDEEGVIIPINSFGVTGLSLNVDYDITPKAVWRIEGRYLKSNQAIFLKGNSAFINNNACISTSIAVAF